MDCPLCGTGFYTIGVSGDNLFKCGTRAGALPTVQGEMCEAICAARNQATAAVEAKLVVMAEALRKAQDSVAGFLDWHKGCDHEVGSCACKDIAALECINAALLSTSEPLVAESGYWHRALHCFTPAPRAKDSAHEIPAVRVVVAADKI